MNKRAEGITSGVTWEIIGLALFVFIAIGIAFAIPKFIGSSNENKELATTQSFLSLAKVIQKYVSDGGAFQPVKPEFHLLQIDSDFIIVGFNKGDWVPIDGCGNTGFGLIGAPLELVDRPAQCGTNACLCLYKQTSGDDDFSADADDPEKRIKPTLCQTFPEVDNIVSFWYHDARTSTQAISPSSMVIMKDSTQHVFRGHCMAEAPAALNSISPIIGLTVPSCGANGQQQAYASLLMYGKCTGSTFGTRSIYVDKVKIDGKTVILVSDPLAPDVIMNRKESVEAKANLLSGSAT